MGTLSQVYRILINKGPIALAKRSINHLTLGVNVTSGIKLFVADRLGTEPGKQRVMIECRSSILDSDKLSLLLECEKLDQIQSVSICCDNITNFKSKNKVVAENTEDFEVDVNIVDTNSSEFMNDLKSCETVFLEPSSNIRSMGLFLSDDWNFIQTTHGLAKAAGRFQNEQHNSPYLKFRRYMKDKIAENSVDMYNVNSDLEMCYRSAAHRISPHKIHKLGYPRFSRLRELEKGSDSPFLSKSSEEKIEDVNYDYKILYAPTHKGKHEKTNLFPFDQFNLDDFHDLLEQHNAGLYIRSHIIENNSDIQDMAEKSNNIHNAGQSFSTSSVEILPYFDLLITDCSSIYFEFLPLDRPIIFAIDESNPYWEKMSPPFDDIYYPGPKVNTSEEFYEEVEMSLQNQNYYSAERDFCNKIMHPNFEDKRYFLSKVLEN